MRVIAYLHPSDDFDAAKASIGATAGITGVALRNARYWDASSRVERGFDRVIAPDYPAIVRAYADAGIQSMDAKIAPMEAPGRITDLPQHDAIAIVCPGRFVNDELAAIGRPSMPIMVVNEAVHVIDQADYFIANDGFIKRMVGAVTDAIRITRTACQHTIPTGKWWAMDHLVSTPGMFTTRCALAVAARAMGAKRIVLIGHDCTPGVGVLTEHWNEGHIEALRNATVSDMVNLASDGVTIDHVRWDGKSVYVEKYEPPQIKPSNDLPTQRTKRRK